MTDKDTTAAADTAALMTTEVTTEPVAAAVVTPDVIAEPEALVAPAAPAPAVAIKQPQIIHLTESAARGMHKITHLLRKGYMLVRVECFNLTGMMLATLQLGNPDPEMVKAADDDVQHAVAMEEQQRQADIERAAAELVASRERAARQAAMADRVAEAEANLAALKAMASA